MTKRKNNDSNNTNPNESSNSDFTDLIFQLQIEKYHSLISILSELRTKAGIFLAMLGVIASIGFSFSAYGVVSQYVNIAAANQSVVMGGAGGLAGNLVTNNSNVNMNNANVTHNIISSSIAIINQFSTDGLTTLKLHLVIVLLILLAGLLIITFCYVYLLNKSFEIKNILSPLSENTILLQIAQDKSGRETYQKKVINQLNIRITELEEIVSFFKDQFKKLDKVVIAFCVMGIGAIMCMNFDQIGFYIALGLVGIISICVLVVLINLIRQKNMMKKWTDSKY